MMVSDRLFAVEATATERAKRTKSNRAAQGSMFDLTAPVAWSCPACGGDRDRCSCATTGAKALALELEHPPSSTPGRYTLEQIHDETLYAPSAADWRPTRPNPCPRDTTHPAHAGPCDTPRCPYCADAAGLHTGPGATAPFAVEHPGFCHQSHHNADDDTWTPCTCPGWLYWPAEQDAEPEDDAPPCINCGRGDGPICSMCGARSTFGDQDPAVVDSGRYWRVLAVELNEQHPTWIGRDGDDLRSWLAHDVTQHMRRENPYSSTQTYGHERDRLADLAAPILQRAHNALAGPLYADHDRWANSTGAGEACPCELCGGEAHYRPALRVDYCTAGTLARQLAEREYPHAYEAKSKRTDACRHCCRSRAECTATLTTPAEALL